MGIVDSVSHQKSNALPIELDEKLLELGGDGRRSDLGQREWRSLLRELKKQDQCLLGKEFDIQSGNGKIVCEPASYMLDIDHPDGFQSGVSRA